MYVLIFLYWLLEYFSRLLWEWNPQAISWNTHAVSARTQLAGSRGEITGKPPHGVLRRAMNQRTYLSTLTGRGPVGTASRPGIADRGTQQLTAGGDMPQRRTVTDDKGER